MKIIEVTKNLKIAITNEEADMLAQFDDDTPSMAKSDMGEREQLLVNQLVNKNLLTRTNENGRITYKRRSR